MAAKIGMTGGQALTTKLSDIAKKVAKAPHVRVGFLEKKKYSDGTPVAMIAAIQEFGAPKVGIPPRPFFRAMITKHRDEWGPGALALLKHNDYDVDKTLAQLGQIMVGQLQESIIDTMAPPLSPVTIMLRSMRRADPSLQVNATVVAEARARVAAGKAPLTGTSGKPLVDTGTMLDSVSAEVKKGSAP